MHSRFIDNGIIKNSNLMVVIIGSYAYVCSPISDTDKNQGLRQNSSRIGMLVSDGSEKDF